MNNSIDICRTVSGIAFKIRRLRAEGKRIGFVPTMGALHPGHASLLKKAHSMCDVVVCSLYPNPTQFDNKDDLAKYPITEKEDLELLQREKVKLAYIPQTSDIYHNIDVKPIDYGVLTNSLEGAHRPGHFNGMSTIVRRLFEVVKPDLAFFGEKDWQQLAIINRMNQEEHLGVDVVSCPIIREDSGLALSSRNRRLSAGEVQKSLTISKVVFSAPEWAETLTPAEVELRGLKMLKEAELEVDYIKVVQADTFEDSTEFKNEKEYRILIAAYSGSVRLIDNGPI